MSEFEVRGNTDGIYFELNKGESIEIKISFPVGTPVLVVLGAEAIQASINEIEATYEANYVDVISYNGLRSFYNQLGEKPSYTKQLWTNMFHHLKRNRLPCFDNGAFYEDKRETELLFKDDRAVIPMASVNAILAAYPDTNGIGDQSYDVLRTLHNRYLYKPHTLENIVISGEYEEADFIS